MSLDIFGKRENEQVAELLKYMREATDHPVRRNWFTHSNQAYEFREGQMWTPDELAVLTARKQAPVVINLIEADRRRFEGQYKRQQLAVSFVGRNAPMDDQSAAVMSDLLRFIDQDTEYAFEETEVVAIDGYVGGFGVMEVGVENGPAGGYRIFTRAEDPYTVFPDPFCRRYDWNDKRGGARYIFRSKWVHIDDAKDKWKKLSKKLEAALEYAASGNTGMYSTVDPAVESNLIANYFDTKKQQIRPVEAWWKERVEKEVIYMPDGSCIDQYDPDEGKRVLKYVKGSYKDSSEVDQLYTAVFAGGVLISKAQEIPYHTTLYPFIPYYAFRKKDGEPFGPVANLMDSNREVNARRSRALYMMNNRKVIFEKGAIADKDALADNMSLADGQVEVQQGYKDKFEIVENTDISAGNLQMLQESKSEFQMLSGEDYLHPSGEIRSGKGIAQAQLPYHLSQVGMFDNIRRTRHMRARLVVDLIKQYYDDDMVFQITDNNDAVKTVKVSAGLLANIKERTFDIVLKDVTEYATLQQEQYDTLQTTLPQIAQFGPAWGRVLVQASDIRQKDEILAQLDAMSKAPPSPPKPSITIKWEELDNVEKAAFALQMGMEELAKHEMQQGSGPQQSDRLQADLTKTLIREGAKSGRDASKAEQDAAGKVADLALQSRSIGVDEQKAAVDAATAQREGDQNQQALDQSAQASQEGSSGE